MRSTSSKVAAVRLLSLMLICSISALTLSTPFSDPSIVIGIPGIEISAASPAAIGFVGMDIPGMKLGARDEGIIVGHPLLWMVIFTDVYALALTRTTAATVMTPN